MGPDVLLAPVLSPGEESVDVVLPPGRGVHVWSGQVHGDPDEVTDLEVDAPVGQPALFAREGSAVEGELAAFVEAERASAG
jgi:alpha-glucosidase